MLGDGQNMAKPMFFRSQDAVPGVPRWLTRSGHHGGGHGVCQDTLAAPDARLGAHFSFQFSAVSEVLERFIDLFGKTGAGAEREPIAASIACLEKDGQESRHYKFI